MKYLLDTHLLLWAGGQIEQLSSSVKMLLNNPDNELFFSAASIWEVTIKQSLGREDFKVNPRIFRRALLDNGYIELPITSEHAVEMEQLQLIHKDPFDRILIAQSLVEGIILLTSDSIVAQYPGPIKKV